jgi:thioredoxin reductase (NADPH)
MQHHIYDIIIVGAGPCGLACGIEAHKAGLSYLVVEKGNIAESIRKYPLQMQFFSTAENIEIGGIPMSIAGIKATRTEALKYYRRVSEYYGLNVQPYTSVENVQKNQDIFEVHTYQGLLSAKNVVLATGYFDCPRSLKVAGENLPHVSKYYDEPFKYVGCEVIIVGGGNSAVEAALDLHRGGVKVTMIVRKDDFKPTAKYWLLPDLRNRVKDGKIKALFHSEVTSIEENQIWVKTQGEEMEKAVKADFVFLLIGYTANVELLAKVGIHLSVDDLVPEYDPHTFATNIQGLYIAGTVACGTHTEKIFIENGRHDGAKIIKHILELRV